MMMNMKPENWYCKYDDNKFENNGAKVEIVIFM